jgi:predicted HicB family RNase H-like nuclease
MTEQPSAAGKAQFNVYLPRPLIRRAKYAAVDTGQSLSQLVDNALAAYLDDLETTRGTTQP